MKWYRCQSSLDSRAHWGAGERNGGQGGKAGHRLAREPLVPTHPANDIYSLCDAAIVRQNDSQKENSLGLGDAVAGGKSEVHNKKAHRSIGKSHASLTHRSASSPELSAGSAPHEEDRSEELSFQHRKSRIRRVPVWMG